MPLATVRGSTLEPQKRYRNVLWAGGYADMDYARNEEQAMQDLAREQLGNTLWRRAGIVSLSELVPTVIGSTVKFTQGRVYVRGRVEPVADTTLTFSPLGSGSVTYLRWSNKQIDQAADPVLANPSTDDPVQDRYQVLVSLATANPDALDEPFDSFRMVADGTPVYQNTLSQIICRNTVLDTNWTLVSGTASSVTIGAARAGCAGHGLCIHHTNGAADELRISVQLQGLTTYHVYVSLRTVYGQPDLPNTSDGFFVRFGGTPPSNSYFGTVGGATLSGDFVTSHFTFTSGAGGAVDFSIGIGAASPTTQVYVSQVLVTTEPLVELDRHYYPIFSGTAMTRVAATAFNVSAGAIPMTARPPVVTATDIQDALNQLADATNLLQEQVVVLDRLFGVSGLIGDRGSSVAPGYNQYTISADTIMVKNFTTTTLPPTVLLTVFNATVDVGVAGPVLNGRDQALAFPAWNGTGGGLINIFAIYGAGKPPGLIASLAAYNGVPNMPAGYTHSAYLTTVMNSNGVGGPVQLIPSTTRGNQLVFNVGGPYRTLAANQTSTTPTAISARQIVPPSALDYTINCYTYYQPATAGVAAQLQMFLDPAFASSSVDGDLLIVRLSDPGTASGISTGAQGANNKAPVPNINLTFYYKWSFGGGPVFPYYTAEFDAMSCTLNNGAF